MKKIAPFDPSGATSGTIHTNGINKNEQLLLYNDSLVSLDLTFADGSEDIIPAGWAKSFIIKNVPMGDVAWSQYVVLTYTNYPVSKCYGVVYEPGEHVADVNMPIPRATNVSNVGGIPTSTTNITNDGNIANTSIIESTQSGNTLGSNVAIDNSGNATFAEYVSSVRTVIFQLIAGASTVLKLAATGRLTEVLGSLQVDQDCHISGTLYGVAGTLTIGDIATANKFALSGAGAQYGLLAGSLSRVSKFSGTGSGTFNHGLGATPDIVIVMTHVNGSQTVGYDSENATSVHITAAAGLAWTAFAIHL